MKPTVRLARPADLDAVLAIEGAWPTTAGWTRAQFASELDIPGSRALVVETDGAVAGFAVYRCVPPDAQILDVAVAPALARRGLGRLLIAELKARAKAEGLSKATLEVSAENAPALALYAASGFTVVGRRPKFYNGRFDAVLMDADLA